MVFGGRQTMKQEIPEQCAKIGDGGTMQVRPRQQESDIYTRDDTG
jgi:hypothetical protein